jgi:hypothetical protein
MNHHGTSQSKSFLLYTSYKLDGTLSSKSLALWIGCVDEARATLRDEQFMYAITYQLLSVSIAHTVDIQ